MYAFVKELSEYIENKDLNDRDVQQHIVDKIETFLMATKKSNIMVKAFQGKMKGKPISEISRECSVSTEVIRNCVIKQRVLIQILNHIGINLPGFENFKERSYTYSQETLQKQEKSRKNKCAGR